MPERLIEPAFFRFLTKRKDFIVSAKLADREVLAADLIDVLLSRYKIALPFMRFLIDASARAR